MSNSGDYKSPLLNNLCRRHSRMSRYKSFGALHQSFYLFLSSQKATADADATLSESTPCCIGIFTVYVLNSIVSVLSPVPSVPKIIASLSSFFNPSSSIETELFQSEGKKVLFAARRKHPPQCMSREPEKPYPY